MKVRIVIDYLFHGVCGMFAMLLVVGCASLISEGFLSLSIIAGLAGIGITSFRFIIIGALVVGLIAGMATYHCKSKDKKFKPTIWISNDGLKKEYLVWRGLYDEYNSEWVIAMDYPSNNEMIVYPIHRFKSQFREK